MKLGEREEHFTTTGGGHKYFLTAALLADAVSAFVLQRSCWTKSMVDGVLALDRVCTLHLTFVFSSHLFLARGLVGAPVLLGNLQACAICIPAAPDVQGKGAKSKPLNGW